MRRKEKTIEEMALNLIRQGKPYCIDLQKRNLMVGKEYLIKDGKSCVGLPMSMFMYETEDLLGIVGVLYTMYKNSIPSTKSESQKDKRYFEALREEELPDDAMLYGINREEAAFELEMFLLRGIIYGFKWDEKLMGKWFYQSPKDKDLVMLRSWFEPDYGKA